MLQGNLVSKENNQSYILAPYQPKNSNYAIEISFKYISWDSDPGYNDCLFYKNMGFVEDNNLCIGLIGRFTIQNGSYDGYIALAGPADTSAGYGIQDFNGNLPISTESGGLTLDHNWHTLRFELTDTSLKMYFDKQLVASQSNTQYTDPGQIGILSAVYAQFDIRSFTVYQG